MFEIVTKRRIRKRDRAFSFASWCYTNPLARAAGGCALIMGGFTILGASYVILFAGPTPCTSIEPTELTMAQLKTIKKKVATYWADPTGGIQLDADEASFILADNLKYPVTMKFDGHQMAANLLIRSGEQERCYTVRFRGNVAVDDGLATVTPSELMVGQLNLSWFAGGQTFQIDRVLMGGGPAGDMLQQTQKLRVEDGQIHVDLEDPRRLR